MAVHLTGNNRLRISSSTILAGATAFSTSFWINFRSIDGTDDAILQVGPDAANRQVLIWRDASSLFSSSVRCLSVAVGDGSTSGQLSSSSDTLDTSVVGKWMHVAVTWQAASGFRLYIDGVADVNQGYASGSIEALRGGALEYALGYYEGTFRQPDHWIAEHAMWVGVVLDDAEVVLLATGLSPRCLTHRIANLGVYQDLIRIGEGSGEGPAMEAVGSPVTVEHPPIHYPRSPAIFDEQTWRLRLASTQCAVAGADSSQSFVAGAEAGATYPFAEVIT